MRRKVRLLAIALSFAAALVAVSNVFSQGAAGQMGNDFLTGAWINTGAGGGITHDYAVRIFVDGLVFTIYEDETEMDFHVERYSVSGNEENRIIVTVSRRHIPGLVNDFPVEFHIITRNRKLLQRSDGSFEIWDRLSPSTIWDQLPW